MDSKIIFWSGWRSSALRESGRTIAPYGPFSVAQRFVALWGREKRASLFLHHILSFCQRGRFYALILSIDSLCSHFGLRKVVFLRFASILA